MSTIVTINASDQITNSRADINANFTALNSDKIETSVIDTDTSLAANSDAKIPSQKAVKAYIDSGGNPLVSEITVGATHSLTTTANHKVIVWAKGSLSENGGGDTTLSLKYNGVTKDTVLVNDLNDGARKFPFALMYTETPGAATADITVTTSQGSLNADVVIMVLKIPA